MKSLLVGIFVLGFVQIASAQNLKEIMEESGETFNEIQRAIIVKKDLSHDTYKMTREMSEMFYVAVTLDAQIPSKGGDLNAFERKKILFRQLMSEILAVVFQLEGSIFDQDMEQSQALLPILRQKRQQAHEIFKN